MRFSKMQGVGNDFVVINTATPGYLDNPQELAVKLCDRKFGVGADGLLIVTRLGGTGPVPDLATPVSQPRAPVAMRMFNPDGSEDMCGNGLRCVGLWAFRHGWLGDLREFDVETKEGPRHLRLLDVSSGGHVATLGVDMGVPRFAASEIPFLGSDGKAVQEFPLTVGDRVYTVTSVNTGSTHTVIFGEQPSEGEFEHYSALMEDHPFYPERTSVLWSTLADSEPAEGEMPFDVDSTTSPCLSRATGMPPRARIDVRIWERAAGETLGCGTGACAVGIAAVRLGLVAPGTETEIVSRGGTLVIRWPGPGEPVDMVGPAVFAYEGDLSLG